MNLSTLLAMYTTHRLAFPLEVMVEVAVWGSAMWGDRAVAAWEFIEQSKAGVLICLCGSCVPSAMMKPGQSDADFSFQYNQRIGRHLDVPTGTERGVNVVPL
jgi:hypothetical protein